MAIGFSNVGIQFGGVVGTKTYWRGSRENGEDEWGGNPFLLFRVGQKWDREAKRSLFFVLF